MTRIGDLKKTLDGIDAAIACDFQQIKLNTVVLRNYNHDEILDLVNFCIDRSIDISFIEEMPLGQNDHHDRAVVLLLQRPDSRRFAAALRTDTEHHDDRRPDPLLPAHRSRQCPRRFYFPAQP